MKTSYGNRIDLGDQIVIRLNHYHKKVEPHKSRPAIVTDALIEYFNAREPDDI